jgi:hypothetical protein
MHAVKARAARLAILVDNLDTVTAKAVFNALAVESLGL